MRYLNELLLERFGVVVWEGAIWTCPLTLCAHMQHEAGSGRLVSFVLSNTIPDFLLLPNLNIILNVM